MFTLFAYFGITDNTINLVINLLLLFLAIIWVALVFWTITDARRRIADPVLVWCAAILSLVIPFLGTIIYMIVRPPEFLEDIRERELEIQASEARLAALSYLLCANCDYEVEKDYLVCPNCLHRLKDPCSKCGKPLDPSWSLCPYCETEVPGASPPRRKVSRLDEEDEEETAAHSLGAEIGEGSSEHR